MKKLVGDQEYAQYAAVVQERMGDITDEEITMYEARYLPRKVELSAALRRLAQAQHSHRNHSREETRLQNRGREESNKNRRCSSQQLVARGCLTDKD